jgi:hypothetical protein
MRTLLTRSFMAIAASTALLSSPTAADAAAAPQAAPVGCPSGSLCVWNNPGFTDGPGTPNGTWFNFPHPTCPNGTWADCASSIYNNGNSCTARVWSSAGFGGPSLSITRGTSIANLGAISAGGTNWNDNIESSAWIC